MTTKIFSGKKIEIRVLNKKDLGKVKEFQDFINSLIEEEAQITLNKKLSLKEEKKWLEEEIRQVKNKKMVFLFAQENNKVIAATDIGLLKGRQSHVGNLGISIRRGYRGMGLGTYLMGEIIKLAKKELRPRPKFVRLFVFPTNKPALKLYKKFGFKKVAKIPKQIQYKGKLIDEIIMILYL
jgi:ribosomal protein S18 acetylase RimI-like enzyme